MRSTRSFLDLRKRRATLLVPLALASALPALAQKPQRRGEESRKETEHASAPPVEIARVGGYPELRVTGEPFFIHGASFDYFRIPRDVWSASLDHYARLGINTISLRIPWNWHEVREGKFDFDGHTNSRRDLRALLLLIAEKGFKLIANPGPAIGADWPNSGLPQRLLAPRNADSAARTNETQKWLEAVGHELAPYDANRKLRVPPKDERNTEAKEREISGPLLFVQLEDPAAMGEAHDIAQTALPQMREALKGAGVEALFTLVLSGANARARHAGAQAFHFTGEWFMHPPSTPLPEEESSSENPAARISPQDLVTLQGTARSLDTQTDFPAIVTGFQAGWPAPRDDTRPPTSWIENTLLSSRLLIAQGIRGLTYTPLQDTLTPAGWEVPQWNRYYRWDAALDLAGRAQPRARSVTRNGRLLELWGMLLAASHPRADFALLDPQSFVAREDTQALAAARRLGEQVDRVAMLAGLTVEHVSASGDSEEALSRNAIVLLPCIEAGGQKLVVPEKMQQQIVDYARRGGTLVYFPSRPEGAILEELWRGAPETAAPASGAEAQAASAAPSWKFGRGKVIEWSKDFYSWARPEEDLQANRGRFEAAWATANLRDLVERAGSHPAVKTKEHKLLITEFISDAGSAQHGTRRKCSPPEDRDALGVLCGRGLLSVTNLNYESPAEEDIEYLSPRAEPQGILWDYLPLHVQIPARESLLLPLNAPLCSEAGPNDRCTDEVVVSGAELHHVEREGKTLRLTLYAPARAALVLHLEEIPSKVSMDESNLSFHWNPEQRNAEIVIPRGAAPGYRRVVEVHLRYTPHVKEKDAEATKTKKPFIYAVANSLRLPLDDTSLPTWPPLVALEADRRGRVLVNTENPDESGHDVHVRVDGAVRGSARVMLDPGEERMERLDVAPGADAVGGDPAVPPRIALIEGQIEARSGSDRRTGPIRFLVRETDEISGYTFDFDRDGNEEWVLEGPDVRAIFSPAAGGRLLAVVDKKTETSLITSVGALRDLLAPPGSKLQELLEGVTTRNLAYDAKWSGEKNDPAVQMSADVPLASGGSALVQKTAHLAGRDTLEVEYHLGEVRGSAASAAELVVASSIPAESREGLESQFCWDDTAAKPASSQATGAPEHCEVFHQGGAALEPPAGIKRIEIRTRGRAGLILEWPEGAARIEMRRFSALVLVHVPPKAAGTPQGWTLRYTMKAAQ